jgi:iron complex transport system ATP-binding protein
MPLMSVVDGGFRYSGIDRWVFRHFDFFLEQGEAVRLAGRNGSGKSTFLKVLSGILMLTEGKLVTAPGLHATYMDQFSGEMLSRELTVSEQIKAARDYQRTSTSTVMETLANFGLDLHHRLNNFIGQLSGGERQIVALVCTLLSGSNVLCLDEFASSLDERSQEIVDGLLSQARESGDITLVLVSHSGGDSIADRKVTLSQLRV